MFGAHATIALSCMRSRASETDNALTFVKSYFQQRIKLSEAEIASGEARDE